ncbi:hypothetical protein [Alicyclobacillus sp. ALC3]|uniref:hypothetical protein n=1 Tax=Alicyclobacillus sp. ALC3 TaxID=2796143 RepID=UPI002378E37F|nr:hypothetical protein [Alicyclobacillus sp. ALC3]WDL96289.1 hypothetical protein JC200_18440 [Alicyclobacillus sp. ALC3]
MSRKNKGETSVSAQPRARQQTTERLTMQQRIDAFFAQSGGPHNPQIKRVLEDHLLYGKDHGVKGHKETVVDALMQTVAADPFLLFMFQQWNNHRISATVSQRPSHASVHSDPEQLADQLSALQAEVAELQRLVQSLVAASSSALYPGVSERQEVQGR